LGESLAVAVDGAGAVAVVVNIAGIVWWNRPGRSLGGTAVRIVVGIAWWNCLGESLAVAVAVAVAVAGAEDVAVEVAVDVAGIAW